MALAAAQNEDAPAAVIAHQEERGADLERDLRRAEWEAEVYADRLNKGFKGRLIP